MAPAAWHKKCGCSAMRRAEAAHAKSCDSRHSLPRHEIVILPSNAPSRGEPCNHVVWHPGPSSSTSTAGEAMTLPFRASSNVGLFNATACCSARSLARRSRCFSSTSSTKTIRPPSADCCFATGLGLLLILPILASSWCSRVSTIHVLQALLYASPGCSLHSSIWIKNLGSNRCLLALRLARVTPSSCSNSRNCAAAGSLIPFATASTMWLGITGMRRACDRPAITSLIT
mmetsp:Transcript_60032/g.119115  ORF Transcript_60032/g.119115 Transcript_60032/m.119115 type:complete len:230 (+) Transcript_60032:273-962(+)